MALIPTDVGVNLRTQVDTPLRATSAIPEIPADLPDLRPGQLFSARIQDVLPENTYKALVAGKSITLSLPAGAKAGDTLELVVVDKTPRMVTARLADPGILAEGGEQAYPHATFSPAAQMIGRLLPAQGESAQPALLNKGQPLLATAPAPGENIAEQLAPQLGKAVSQSGLFYEAHQAKWVAGQLPTQSLLAEPQNRLLQANGSDQSPQSATRENPIPTNLPHPPGIEKTVEPSAPGLKDVATSANMQSSPNTQSSTAADNAARTPQPQVVPEELRHLVQQQLDTAATQRMAWHGEVWPQQAMDWEIQRDAPQRYNGEEEAADTCTTRLALTMPKLGRVEATLELRSKGIHVGIKAPAEESAAELQQGLSRLAGALEAAGVAPLSLRVWQSEPGNE
ncbi:MAG: flagellar hook-length control protein FliK [Rhodocyclaceae bacterium]|nr:MAG: flagellar hook-length control protein FliK [Rhodocyclaceae bacterium]